MSAEERRDILKEIEKIASKQRIKVQDDTFEIKPERRGIGLRRSSIWRHRITGSDPPLIWILFNRQQREIATVTALDTSAEAALIQQISRAI